MPAVAQVSSLASSSISGAVAVPHVLHALVDLVVHIPSQPPIALPLPDAKLNVMTPLTFLPMSTPALLQHAVPPLPGAELRYQPPPFPTHPFMPIPALPLNAVPPVALCRAELRAPSLSNRCLHAHPLSYAPSSSLARPGHGAELHYDPPCCPYLSSCLSPPSPTAVPPASSSLVHSCATSPLPFPTHPFTLIPALPLNAVPRRAALRAPSLHEGDGGQARGGQGHAARLHL